MVKLLHSLIKNIILKYVLQYLDKENFFVFDGKNCYFYSLRNSTLKNVFCNI